MEKYTARNARMQHVGTFDKVRLALRLVEGSTGGARPGPSAVVDINTPGEIGLEHQLELSLGLEDDEAVQVGTLGRA